MEEFIKSILPFMPAFIAGLLVWNGILSNRQTEANRAQKLVNSMVETQAHEIAALIKAAETDRLAREAAEVERDAKTAELVKHTTENSQALAKVETALVSAKALAEEVAEQRDTLKKQLDATNIELENTRKLMNDRLQEVQTNLDKLNEDYEGMTTQYTALQAERARVEKALQERVEKLENDNRLSLERINALTLEIADLRTKLKDTERDRDNLKLQNDALKAEQDALKARVNELENERDILLRQVNEQTTHIGELRAELDELRTRAQDADKPTEPPTDAALPLSED